MKIAILSFDYYSPEVSPVLKSVADYLQEKNVDTRLIITALAIASTFTLKNVKIVTIINRRLNNIFYVIKKNKFHRVNRLLSFFEIKLNEKKLKDNIRGVDFIYCMEFPSLDFLNRIKFDLSKVVYFSLESIDFIKKYEKEYAVSLLEKCKFCVIQSKERHHDLEMYLGHTFNFKYFPVSIRPIKKSDNVLQLSSFSNKINIIYSGYFAAWASVYELSEALINAKSFSGIVFSMQGHNVSTVDYYLKVKELVHTFTNVSIEDKFYSDEEHQVLLKKNDIGIAIYTNNSGSVNWDNLLFSSGKIATYLWAGLGVITNIKSEHTLKPPFLFIEKIAPDTMDVAISSFKENPILYKESAIAFAEKYYNANVYLDTIYNSTLL